VDAENISDADDADDDDDTDDSDCDDHGGDKKAMKKVSDDSDNLSKVNRDDAITGPSLDLKSQSPGSSHTVLCTGSRCFPRQ